MFEVPLSPLGHTDPWALPLAQRLRMVQRSERRVAYYYRAPDSSTFRYRCYAMAQAINTHIEGASASWFHAEDGPYLTDLVTQVDVLVVCRSKYTAELAQLITIARAAGTRVLFDCDDLVFDLKYVGHLLQALDQLEVHEPASEVMWDFWFADIARLRATLMLCDGMIVTNQYLADRAAESVDVPIPGVANFMSREQADYSQHVFEAREAAGDTRDGLLHIGYFSGTPTHNKDFAIALGGLRRALERHDHVRLRVAGYLPPAATQLTAFGDRVELLPFTDFLNLQRVIAATEVNVAPLQNLVFSNCKSELKYFDAAAVGIPTIASPTFTMGRAIDHGRTGLLAGSDEWDEMLELLISDYDGLGRKLGRAAYDDAHARHTAVEHLPAIRAALDL